MILYNIPETRCRGSRRSEEAYSNPERYPSPHPRAPASRPTNRNLDGDREAIGGRRHAMRLCKASEAFIGEWKRTQPSVEGSELR